MVISFITFQDAMLREYQDEIKSLKDQLEATQRGVMIDENGQVLQLIKFSGFWFELLFLLHSKFPSVMPNKRLWRRLWSVRLSRR
jgi:hypothetical protein